MLSNPNYLELFNHPNSDLQGGITAAMPAGSFGGALLNSWLSDKIGRKKCIILSGYVWCIGCAIQAGAHNVATLVAGRVVAGIAVGIASAIVTVYQAEISKPSIRGRIVSIQQLAIMTGIMLQYFCTLGFSYIDSDVSFRAPWALQMIPGLLLGTLMWAFPESPRWLCDHGHWDAGLQVLADVHADGDTENEFVQQEFNEIRRQIEFDHTQAAKSYLDLVKPDVRLRVIIGCCTQIWSQLSGMMIVYVFQSAGVKGRRGELIASSVQYALGVLCTIPTVFFIDKIGRRPLLLAGSALMATFLLIVGGLSGGFGKAVADASASDTTTWAIEGNDAVRNAIIVCSYLFVCSFAATWGPVSWTYCSELFPTKVRGKAVSFTTASNWTFNFVLAMIVPPAFRNIQWKTYIIFAVFNLASFTQVFIMFPETKGYTLEEMEVVFNSGNAFTAWRANRIDVKAALADLEANHAGASDAGLGEKDEKHEVEHVEHSARSSPAAVRPTV
ncbi:hypothetical protein JCM10449v2_007184 [Rhodotorula kratochvilovae]